MRKGPERGGDGNRAVGDLGIECLRFRGIAKQRCPEGNAAIAAFEERPAEIGTRALTNPLIFYYDITVTGQV